MSSEHFQVLMRHSPPWLRRLLVFLKATGCRPAEAMALMWDDVHLNDCQVLLGRHRAKWTEPRTIPLPTAALRLLSWMRDRKTRGQQLVFLAPSGNRLTPVGLATVIRRARIRAGLPGSVRLLRIRRAWPVRAMQAGVDPRGL
jgi:integrase